jgi:hypothetical protein
MSQMMQHSARIGPKQGIFEESSTAMHKVGEKLVLDDGSVFYYAKASEAIAVAQMCTFKPVIYTEDTVTVAHPIGTTSVTITASAAIAANEMAEGYLVVDEGTGAGERYKIKSHLAIGNGATGLINLYDGLRTAWVIANTDITLYPNLFNSIQIANDRAECPAGVPLIAVTSAYYFWLQTWGFACVYVDGTASQLGAIETERNLTLAAGAVDVQSVTTLGAPYVGQVVLDAADMIDAQYAIIMLQIMP